MRRIATASRAAGAQSRTKSGKHHRGTSAGLVPLAGKQRTEVGLQRGPYDTDEYVTHAVARLTEFFEMNLTEAADAVAFAT